MFWLIEGVWRSLLHACAHERLTLVGMNNLSMFPNVLSLQASFFSLFLIGRHIPKHPNCGMNSNYLWKS
jgi:hypothetical protein